MNRFTNFLFFATLFTLFASGTCDKKSDDAQPVVKLNTISIGPSESYFFDNVVVLRQGSVFQIIGEQTLTDGSKVSLVIQMPGPNPAVGTTTIRQGSYGTVAAPASLEKLYPNRTTETRRFGAVGEAYIVTSSGGKVSISFADLSPINSAGTVVTGSKLSGAVSE